MTGKWAVCVVAVIAVVGAVAVVPAGLSAQPAPDDISVRDQLIADQENLLNAYRCLFGVDTDAVAGGCDNPDTVSPGPPPQSPTQADLDIRDELIQSQETLLNVYRCQYNTDTQLVPGGCQTKPEAEPANTYTAISVGKEHACAIAADQTLECWGGSHGQWTDKSTNRWDTYAPPPDGRYTAVAAVDRETCAIAVDGTIECWGESYGGIVGHVTGPSLRVPGHGRVSTVPDGRYTAIAGGGSGGLFTFCAIAVDGPIDCWGSSHRAKINAPEGQYTALAVTIGSPCAVAVDRAIYCWGGRWDGSEDRTLDLDGDHIDKVARAAYDDAVQDGADRDAAAAIYDDTWSDAFESAFDAAAAAREPNEMLSCFGQHRLDGCGVASGGYVPNGRYTAIDVANGNGCAIAVDGTIDCWGYGFSGTIVAPCVSIIQIPCSLDGQHRWEGTPPDGRYTALAVNQWFGCAIAADGTIDCWGFNREGQTTPPDGQYTAISTGDGNGGFTCAIAVDGTINCWGAVPSR